MNQIELVAQALGIEIANRKGRRAWALCPFHQDHSPTNFFIRVSGPRRGQNHCFSCKQGGTLIDLVMHVRSCDFPTAEAFIKVCGKGYEPPRVRARIVARPPKLGRVRFKMPAEVYFEPLEKWVKLARTYAVNRCLFTAEEIDRFGIGYAVDGKLAGRIVIPWRGPGGIIAGYSARTFVEEEPKYLTPDEDENADLGVMFGEHTWTSYRDAIVVTEGALNGMAVLRALEDYRVDISAMGGSDINPLHMIKLSTFANVVILTDSDPAGDKAAIAMRSALGRHTNVDRLRLPDTPDERGKVKDALDVGRTFLRERLVEVLDRLGVRPVVSLAS